jgi:hypothetical protein
VGRECRTDIRSRPPDDKKPGRQTPNRAIEEGKS